MKIFKKIAAALLAAVTLASTMVSASAWEVNDDNWNKLNSGFVLTASNVTAYPEFTKAELDAYYAKHGQNQYWLKGQHSMGAIVGVYEKGMSFEDAFKYTARMRIKDTRGYFAVLELKYNKALDRYYMVTIQSACRNAAELARLISVPAYVKPHTSPSGIWSVSASGPVPLVLADSSRCVPAIQLIDMGSGKVLEVRIDGYQHARCKTDEIPLDYLSTFNIYKGGYEAGKKCTPNTAIHVSHLGESQYISKFGLVFYIV